MEQGVFITIEGGEGAGKTTIISRLAAELSALGDTVTITREPGGIPIAEQIRAVILDRNHTGMDGRTEALLYAAARRQHLVEKVVPALEKGHVVLCDRFIDSSLAYQGHARGIGMEAVLAINAFAIDGMMPKLTLYLDVRPEVGLRRIQEAEVREINRIDLEAITFHEQVREGFLQLAQMYSDRIVVIDAEQSADAVFEQCMSIILKRRAGF
ncbi:thymidylate kinase [Paenibacillus curdlanolyticus YK9]|uniref:Thymidylate kinase n=1 Tax=Paenibacillus curdlanolyticus YK9 TaxID=717606 RepID=E0I972_9BACL|nr:dTMP kinase [Paenibacillus curdlanolyticus]EFM10956.1 thymidylate kinase [Paenibacillus curdlanolyticus YK9]